jgi:quercetin dioxygenase-like cupin family protein
MISEKALPNLSLLASEEVGIGVWANQIELDPADIPLAPFSASRFTVQPGCSTPVDSHAVREIWIVSAGEGLLTYDDQQSRIGSSDVLYFEPPKKHVVKNDGVETMVIFSIWWNS